MLKIFKASSNQSILLINKAIFLSWITVARFPLITGQRDNLIIRAAYLFPILIGILINISYIRKNITAQKIDIPLLTIFLSLIFLSLASLVRTALFSFNDDALYCFYLFFSIIAIFLFLFLSFWATPHPDDQIQLIKWFTYGFGIYISINLLLYFAGIGSPGQTALIEYPAQMLSFMGINANRVIFPMAEGFNSFALVTTVTLAGLVHFSISKQGVLEKILVPFMMTACGIVLLLTDSRAALGFIFFSLSISILPKQPLMVMRWVIVLLSIIPLILGLVIPSGGENALPFLTRPPSDWINPESSNTNSACLQAMAETNGFLTNRPVIWNAVIEELEKYTPTHLVGYGFRGQIASGVSQQYSCLFTSQVNNLIQSSHNIWLQTILDTGYLGIFALVSFFVLCLVRLGRMFSQHERVSRGFFAVLFVIILNGSMESSLSLDFDGVFWWVMIMATGIIFLFPSIFKLNLEQTSQKEMD